MQLHPLDQQVSALLKDVADNVVMPYFCNLGAEDVDEKAPDDLVTIADRMAELKLAEGLGNLLPNAKIVGEEAWTSNPAVMQDITNSQTWIIDPIDGTGNYARGETSFAIMVALAEYNETVAGWIYDPVRRRMCHTHLGNGAFINGKTFSAANHIPRKPKAALALRYMNEVKREKATKLIEDRFTTVPIPSCAAEQYYLLASGEHHFTIFEKTLPWDHAAGVLFLNEAGGRAARWDGSPFRPGDERKGLLGATTPALWEEVAELFGHAL